MGINLSKLPHVLFFVVFLPLISILSGWYFNELFPDIRWWSESLSPLTAYGLFYWLFDKYLWKIWIFRVLGITVFPDLRGRWKGVQRSSYQENGVNVVTPSYLEIRQSFTEICICSYYTQSKSASTVANFVESNTGDYLYYTYDNDPNSFRSGTMAMHKGTVKLECVSKNKIIGSYFNSLGNNGDMDFDFESKKLLRRFV